MLGRLSKSQRGASAEATAADYLVKQGLRIIDKNFRCRGGEIDIIAQQRADAASPVELVFIEVRYRKSNQHGGAAASVNNQKQKRLVTAAGHFIAQNPGLAEFPARFDVLALEGELAHPQIDWLQDAFQLN